jgi:SAM-dependent methyltransferase
MDLWGLTPEAMHTRIRERKAGDPEFRALCQILGPRVLEWAHSIGVATDPALASAVPPVPPLALRQITAEINPALFLQTGIGDLRVFLELYAIHGPKLTRRPVVLDFGCGAGRMLRFVDPQRWVIFGSEVNPDHVAWCQANLPAATIWQNDPLPPLKAEAAAFDLVYSLSIFSHLSRSGIAAWLDEFARITARGGLVIVTYHGPEAMRIVVDSAGHQEVLRISRDEAQRMLERLPGEAVLLVPYPQTLLEMIHVGGPDYGLTFIDPGAAEALGRAAGFQVVSHVPLGIRNFQNVLVLRRC